MSLLLRNVVATFVGTAWVGVMNVVLAPFVIRALGVEGYGLLGVFMTLQGLIMPVGAAVSSVLMRETARLRRLDDRRGERELAATFELIHLGAALALVLILVLAAPVIVSSWIEPRALPVAAVVRALRYIGIAVALQLPIAAYSGGLMGLERHVASNTVNTVAVTVRTIVALVLLNRVPTADAFFAWQAAATVLQLVALRIVMWHFVPAAPGARMNRAIVRPLFALAGGVLATSILGTLLAQSDKVILSRVVPLADFGRYALAATLATATGIAVAAVSLAFMPRLSGAAAHGDEGELADTYHRACQLMSVLLLPLAGVLAVFPVETLYIWTGNMTLARSAAPVMTLLVAGWALNGLVAVPYALQIASGWTSLWARINVIAVLLVIPAMIAGAELAGGIGTAAVWLALNAAYAVIGVPLMHRRLLRGHERRWILADILVPGLVTAAVLVAFRLALPIGMSRILAAIELAAIGSIAAIGAVVVTPLVRIAVADALSLRSVPR